MPSVALAFPKVKPTRPDPGAGPRTMTDAEFRALTLDRAAATPRDGWSLGYASAHLLTALVVERVEDGDAADDAVDAVWGPTDPEFRAEALAYIAGFGPARDFAGWIASCLVGEPIDGPASDAPPYSPTEDEDREVAGLNADGDDDGPPPCPDDEPDWDSMFAGYDPHDPAVRVEVQGHRAYATTPA